MELTCQKSLQLHLPHRVLWLVTKSSGYNLPQILWNLLALLGKTITRQLEHIYSKILAFRICKHRNSRFLHSLSMVGDSYTAPDSIQTSNPTCRWTVKPINVTKWSKWVIPCMDFKLWTPTTFFCYKVTWKRFSSMLLVLHAVLPFLPPPSRQSFLF